MNKPGISAFMDRARRSLAVIPLAVILLLFTSTSFAAPASVRYVYEGNAYDYFSSQFPSQVSRLRGSFTTAGPLSPNLAGQYVIPTEFRLTDGYTTVTQLSNLWAATFRIWTDPSGEIESWEIRIERSGSFGADYDPASLVTTGGPALSAVDGSVWKNNLGQNRLAQSRFNAGTWTKSAQQVRASWVGTVKSVTPGITSVNVGDRVEGSFVYDAAEVPVASFSTATQAVYGPNVDLAFAIHGAAGTRQGRITGLSPSVNNNHGGSLDDGFSLGGRTIFPDPIGTGDAVDGFQLSTFSLFFNDSTGTAFDSVALPADLQLTQFDYHGEGVLTANSSSIQQVRFEFLSLSAQLADSTAPVAIPGPDLSANPGERIRLDGSYSYDDVTAPNDLLYEWRVLESPSGSRSDLETPNLMQTRFRPDLPGQYVISLRVSDGAGNTSLPVALTLTAELSMSFVYRNVGEYANLTTAPVISGGRVAFALGEDALQGPSLIVDDAGDQSVVVGGRLPDDSGAFRWFSSLSLRGDALSFKAQWVDDADVSDGDSRLSIHSGIWTYDGSSVTKRVDPEDPQLVDPVDQSDLRHLGSVSGGQNFAVDAVTDQCLYWDWAKSGWVWYRYCSEYARSVYTLTNGALERVAYSNSDTHPSLEFFDEGTTLFSRRDWYPGPCYSSSCYRTDVFQFNGSVFSQITSPATLLPPGETSLRGAGQARGADGDVVFRGYSRDAGTTGIYLSDGTLRLIADTNSAVPGRDAHFTSLQSPSLDEGNVTFTAQYVRAPAEHVQGYYGWFRGRLVAIVESGDILDAEVVQVPWVAAGQSLSGYSAAFGVKLVGGTSAVYVATLDADGDGYTDDIDVCPEFYGTDRSDMDGNGIGDECQDSDGDTYLDLVDVCPVRFDNQSDSDGDLRGDACDTCPFDYNPNPVDTDGDDIANICDWDDDGDTVDDMLDNCPLVLNGSQANLDGDAFGDACDSDKDSDGIANSIDGYFVQDDFIDESELASDNFALMDDSLDPAVVHFGVVDNRGGIDLRVAEGLQPETGLKSIFIDAAGPNDSGGNADAFVKSCGLKPPDGRMRIALGDSVYVRCGSLIVEGQWGTVELELGGVLVVARPGVRIEVEETTNAELRIVVPPYEAAGIEAAMGENIVLRAAPGTVAEVRETVSQATGATLFELGASTESVQPLLVEIGGQPLVLEPGADPAVPAIVDIKPGSQTNSINLGSEGGVPVAIFSSAAFDATYVDPTTVTLASAPVRLRGKGKAQASAQDVNGDGLLDLVVHVDTSTLELSDESQSAILEGMTFEGTLIRGADAVTIVP